MIMEQKRNERAQQKSARTKVTEECERAERKNASERNGRTRAVSTDERENERGVECCGVRSRTERYVVEYNGTANVGRNGAVQWSSPATVIAEGVAPSTDP